MRDMQEHNSQSRSNHLWLEGECGQWILMVFRNKYNFFLYKCEAIDAIGGHVI